MEFCLFFFSLNFLYSSIDRLAFFSLLQAALLNGPYVHLQILDIFSNGHLTFGLRLPMFLLASIRHEQYLYAGSPHILRKTLRVIYHVDCVDMLKLHEIEQICWQSLNLDRKFIKFLPQLLSPLHPWVEVPHILLRSYLDCSLLFPPFNFSFRSLWFANGIMDNTFSRLLD